MFSSFVRLWAVSCICSVLNSIRLKKEPSFRSSMANTTFLKTTPSTRSFTSSSVSILTNLYVITQNSSCLELLCVSAGAASQRRVCSFLGSMLKINPEERLSISELVNQLQEIAAARNVNPKSPITEVQSALMLYFVLKDHICYRLTANILL